MRRLVTLRVDAGASGWAARLPQGPEHDAARFYDVHVSKT